MSSNITKECSIKTWIIVFSVSASTNLFANHRLNIVINCAHFHNNECKLLLIWNFLLHNKILLTYKTISNLSIWICSNWIWRNVYKMLWWVLNKYSIIECNSKNESTNTAHYNLCQSEISLAFLCDIFIFYSKILRPISCRLQVHFSQNWNIPNM